MRVNAFIELTIYIQWRGLRGKAADKNTSGPLTIASKRKRETPLHKNENTRDKLKIYRKQTKTRELKETMVVKKINLQKIPLEMKGSLLEEVK